MADPAASLSHPGLNAPPAAAPAASADRSSLPSIQVSASQPGSSSGNVGTDEPRSPARPYTQSLVDAFKTALANQLKPLNRRLDDLANEMRAQRPSADEAARRRAAQEAARAAVVAAFRNQGFSQDEADAMAATVGSVPRSTASPAPASSAMGATAAATPPASATNNAAGVGGRSQRLDTMDWESVSHRQRETVPGRLDGRDTAYRPSPEDNLRRERNQDTCTDRRRERDQESDTNGKRFNIKPDNIGVFNGQTVTGGVSLEFWCNRVEALLDSECSYEYKLALLKVLPLCLRHSAAKWYNALRPERRRKLLRSWDKFCESLEKTFAGNLDRARLVADARVWDLAVEDSSNYFWDKYSLLRAAYPDRNNSSLCSDICAGLPDSFKTLIRTTLARNPEPERLLEECLMYEIPWRNS
ncbi:uncharacterized protein PFL1_05973 [Pseudozyma flocculosa PF-1]|nr:uncharacterized protein PFL1_05973 [Pseudozyma flocculosa PF-1]EPQ26324.1 hypothetical protein PFL1_05973 [Pseudozyma flocculosa PF-1]